jgi:tRNA pseudouridine32 synthase / 23S rRNA pseudouridine746 synthase
VTVAPPLQVVFADDAVVVLNKPSGLLSVPGKGPHLQDCLSARVQSQYPDALIVHRLDMATSGLLVMARRARVQRQLSQAFASRTVDKRYVALVGGQLVPSPTHEWRDIDLPIGPDWPQRPRQKVDTLGGKPSLTRYRVIGYDARADTTRLELAPLTGRTHQLRVHLQALGHAILGDQLYACPLMQAKSCRLSLHASRLSLAHPDSGTLMTWFSAPPF